jgi:hypothetical protein
LQLKMRLCLFIMSSPLLSKVRRRAAKTQSLDQL